MIDVVRDTEGVRRSLEEIFEEDFARSRIERQLADSGAAEATRARIEATIPARTLSPGYYEFALHLLKLDQEREAGILFTASDLADFEARGLVELGRARSAFHQKHPPCSACGAHQANRFGSSCDACGAEFRRKKR